MLVREHRCISIFRIIRIDRYSAHSLNGNRTCRKRRKRLVFFIHRNIYDITFLFGNNGILNRKSVMRKQSCDIRHRIIFLICHNVKLTATVNIIYELISFLVRIIRTWRIHNNKLCVFRNILIRDIYRITYSALLSVSRKEIYGRNILSGYVRHRLRYCSVNTQTNNGFGLQGLCYRIVIINKRLHFRA